MDAILRELDEATEAIVDDWRKLARREPTLSTVVDLPFDASVVGAVIAALAQPQPIDVDDEATVRAKAANIATNTPSVGIAIRTLLCLTEAIAQRLRSAGEGKEGEIQSRLRVIAMRMAAVAAAEKAALLDAAANHDGLTGLRNLRAFRQDCGEELAKARGSSEALCVVYMDLDGLKQVNDESGHEAGNALLITFAKAITEVAQAGWTSYRWGGDEYAYLITRCDDAHVKAILEQLSNQGEVPTFSWGIATFPADSDQIQELLEIADERMRIMKAQHKAGDP